MAKKKAKQTQDPADMPYWQDRELSWLSYASRILDQSADETVPLLDRLSFMSIFQSDLHQFFRQRVGSLENRMSMCAKCGKKKEKVKEYERLSQLSQSIYAKAGSFAERADSFYTKTSTYLRNWGVSHVHGKWLGRSMPEYQRIYLQDYVRRNVIEYLAPHVIDEDAPFPYLEDGTVYVAVSLEKKGKKGKELLGLMALPPMLERLIELPTGKPQGSTVTSSMQLAPVSDSQKESYSFVLMEDALEFMASEIFPNYEVRAACSVALYRSADLARFEEIDSDDADYLSEVDKQVDDTVKQYPVLLLTRHGFEGHAAKLLRKGLGLQDYQIQESGLPLDLSYVSQITDRLSPAALKRLTWPPYKPKWLRTGSMRLNPNRSILDQVADHDVLLNFPYESMDPFLMMLEEAADDPDVSAIHMTIYRLAKDSKIAKYLMDAAENGKKVTCVMELRASFDEGANAQWAKRFEDAGIHVVYGLPEYKVHGKICCITRSKGGAVQRIVQLGTGNYDEKTATEYTDFCFMTADELFGRDASALFFNIEKERISSEYRSLCISPTQIKQMLVRKIDEQIKDYRDGYEAGIFFKVNAVTDPEIIEKLVEASQAGVPVVMIVRDSTCMLPGIEGYTENIRIASLVGRLLEHSRIFGFGSWDDMEIYLSSADLMHRNMDKRIEIAWPIENNTLRTRIIQYANLCLNDTAKLRELLPDGQYTPLGALANAREDGKVELFDSQEYLLNRG